MRTGLRYAEPMVWGYRQLENHSTRSGTASYRNGTFFSDSSPIVKVVLEREFALASSTQARARTASSKGAETDTIYIYAMRGTSDHTAKPHCSGSRSPRLHRPQTARLDSLNTGVLATRQLPPWTLYLRQLTTRFPAPSGQRGRRQRKPNYRRSRRRSTAVRRSITWGYLT